MILSLFSFIFLDLVFAKNLVVTDIGIGATHQCRIQEQSVYCAGVGSSGQLGNGRRYHSTQYVQVQNIDEPVTSVKTTLLYSCAHNRQTIYCWGYLPDDEIALSAKKMIVHPQANIDQIYLSQKGICYSTRSAEVLCQSGEGVRLPEKLNAISMFGFGDDQFCYVKQNRLYCESVYADSTSKPSELKIEGNPTLRNLKVGPSHACIVALVHDHDEVYCWGNHSNGQLGSLSREMKIEKPTRVDFIAKKLPRVSHLELSDSHTCVSRGDRLYCWGNNQFGQVQPFDQYIPKLSFRVPQMVPRKVQPDRLILSPGSTYYFQNKRTFLYNNLK